MQRGKKLEVHGVTNNRVFRVRLHSLASLRCPGAAMQDRRRVWQPARQLARMVPVRGRAKRAWEDGKQSRGA